MSLFGKSSLYIKDSNEKDKNKEILEIIQSKLENCDLYTKESIKYIMGVLSHINFIESSIQFIMKKFREEPCVSLEEKKSYKINTRQKINKTFFDLLSENGKHQEYVTNSLELTILTAQNQIHNKYQLLQFKKLGINKVQIMCCNGNRDCTAVKKYCDRVYSIYDVPKLPLPECNAELCRCIYISVIE